MFRILTKCQQTEVVPSQGTTEAVLSNYITKKGQFLEKYASFGATLDILTIHS